MPKIEAQFGVAVEALHAVHLQYDDNAFIKLMFDIVGESPISQSLFIAIAAYNEKSQLIGRGELILAADQFVGLESMEFTLECEGIPAKIRIYPKPISVSPLTEDFW